MMVLGDTKDVEEVVGMRAVGAIGDGLAPLTEVDSTECWTSSCITHAAETVSVLVSVRSPPKQSAEHVVGGKLARSSSVVAVHADAAGVVAVGAEVGADLAAEAAAVGVVVTVSLSTHTGWTDADVKPTSAAAAAGADGSDREEVVGDVVP